MANRVNHVDWCAAYMLAHRQVKPIRVRRNRAATAEAKANRRRKVRAKAWGILKFLGKA